VSGETTECQAVAAGVSGGSEVCAQRRMTTPEWGMLVGLSVLWGGSFLFTSIALEELPALTIVLLRLALASAGLVIVLRIMGLRLPRDRHSWLGYGVMGLLNNALPFCLIAWAQIHLTSPVVSTLNATSPFATILLAHLCTDSEKLTPGSLLGVVSGMTGVAVMMGVGWPGDMDLHITAHLACLLAAASYACAGVFGLRFRRRDAAPITNAAGQLIAAMLLLLPVAVILDRPFELAMPGPDTWAAIIGLAVLSTALAYILYFRILIAAGATNLLLVAFLIPVSAAFFGVTVLGEEIGVRELVGFGFIGFGLAAIDGRAFSLILGLK
jgi:drug/metabolite transporter (DMT)-like permease